MTLTLEMAPETQRALEEKAARLGVPVENYALTILRRDLEDEANRASTRDDFLARAQALDERLETTGFQGVDSAQIIREAREERTARILGEGRDDD